MRAARKWHMHGWDGRRGRANGEIAELLCWRCVCPSRGGPGGDRQPLASLGKDKGYSSHDEAITRKKINVEIRLRCAALGMYRPICSPPLHRRPPARSPIPRSLAHLLGLQIIAH